MEIEPNGQDPTAASPRDEGLSKRHNCPACGARLFFREAIPASDVSCMRCGHQPGTTTSSKRKSEEKKGNVSTAQTEVAPRKQQPASSFPVKQAIDTGWSMPSWGVGDGLRLEYWGIGLMALGAILVCEETFLWEMLGISDASEGGVLASILPSPWFFLGIPLLTFVTGNCFIIVGRCICFSQSGSDPFLIAALVMAFLCPLALLGQVCMAFYIHNQHLGQAIDSQAKTVGVLLLLPLGVSAAITIMNLPQIYNLASALVLIVAFLSYIRLLNIAARELA